jgi:hypothetical protein
MKLGALVEGALELVAVEGVQATAVVRAVAAMVMVPRMGLATTRRLAMAYTSLVLGLIPTLGRIQTLAPGGIMSGEDVGASTVTVIEVGMAGSVRAATISALLHTGTSSDHHQWLRSSTRGFITQRTNNSSRKFFSTR